MCTNNCVFRGSDFEHTNDVQVANAASRLCQLALQGHSLCVGLHTDKETFARHIINDTIFQCIYLWSLQSNRTLQKRLRKPWRVTEMISVLHDRTYSTAHTCYGIFARLVCADMITMINAIWMNVATYSDSDQGVCLSFKSMILFSICCVGPKK